MNVNKIKKIIQKFITTYNHIPVAARAGMWFVACTMLQKCVAFITVPIFTRIMPTEEYGLYSTYLSWFAVLDIFCTLNVNSTIYINNYTKANTQEEKDQVAVPLLSLSMTVTFVLFVLYLVLYPALKQVISMPFYLMCLLFIQILFEPPVSMWSTQQRFEFQYVKLVARTIAMVIANSCLGVVFVLLANTNQAIARALSIVIVQIVFGSYFYFYFWKRGNRLFSTKGWKHALDVQLPLLPHSLSLTVLSSSDKIMITNIVGATFSAIYSVAYSAGYVVNVLKNSIVDALRPWVYQKLKQKNYEAIGPTINTIMVLVTVITVCFTAFAPEIIFIMAPAKYYEAIYVIPPVAASSYFTFLYNIFSIVSFYYEKTKKIMFASVSGAVLNIALNTLLIPKFGYIAAAYTTLICYIFLAIAHYRIMRGIVNEYMDNVIIYDMRFIVMMAIVTIGFTALFLFTYKITILRYAVLILVLTFCVVKRKVFLGTLKELKSVKKKR